MKITVYNSKGGVGKTRISINLALMLDCAIITNDENTLTLESVFDENHYMKLKRDQPLEILPDDYNIVFDFGGFADPRVKTAIAQSNWVIVPTLPENDEIQATLNIISEIEKLNKNIIVIANCTVEKEDFSNVKTAINQNFPEYKVVEIKKSRALPNITYEKKSIRAMVEEGGLKRYTYRKIAQQFEDLAAILIK